MRPQHRPSPARSVAVCLGVILLAMGAARPAHAGVIITAGSGGGNPGQNVLFNHNALTLFGLTVNGRTNHTNSLLNIMSGIPGGPMLVASGGQTRVTADHGVPFGTVTFAANPSPTPAQAAAGLIGMASFTDFAFSIDAECDALGTIRAYSGTTLLGSAPVSLFSNGMNQFRVRATGTDLLTSIVFTASENQIADVRQIRVGGAAAPVPPVAANPVPEPATLVVFAALAGVGLVRSGRSRRAAG